MRRGAPAESRSTMSRLLVLAVAAVVAAATWLPGHAVTFHLMQIEQVIGGVGGDTSAQAIQLRMRAPGQNFIQFSRIVAWDATGANPVVIATPAAAVANGALGDRVLIATPAFLAATNPTAVADVVMTNPIPPSYLAAGSLTFEDSGGASVLWRLSWGGAAYTGPTTGAITNDADGEFGPPWPGALPSTGTQALRFQGAAADPSVSNASDYALTPGDAVFVNNAGASFTVQTATAVGGRLRGVVRLEPNVPNPFNPTTAITFELDRPAPARLDVIDGHGRRVVTLFDALAPSGRTTLRWDGRDASGSFVATGVYFARLRAAGRVQTTKMTLVK